MKDALKAAAGAVAKKTLSWLLGAVGLSLGSVAFWGVLLLIVLLFVIGAVSSISSNDEFGEGTYEVNGLSPHVLAYQPIVEKYANQEGIGEYVPVILAIMQRESGGSPNSSDPMQSSESLCGYVGCITNPEHSIQQGVKHFKNVLQLAEGDLKLAISSYNFGTAFVGHVKKINGKYEFNKKIKDKETYDVALKYSQDLYAKEVSNGRGHLYTCKRQGVDLTSYKACYGDVFYVFDVVSYLTVLESGGSIPHSGTFIMPAKGTLTSPFGYRTHPRTGVRKFHAGIDLGLVTGTPIHASASGVVSKVQTGCTVGRYSCGGGWGNHVFVDHMVEGKRYTTNYAHLSSVNVKLGQKVEGGQMIGKSGNTGSSTGPHLHFEIHEGGYRNPVDPMKYLK